MGGFQMALKKDILEKILLAHSDVLSNGLFTWKRSVR